MKKHYILAVLMIILAACSEDATLDMAGMFSPQGPTVNTRFAQSMTYNDSIGEIHLDMKNDNYLIYVCSDSHITKKAHQNLDDFIEAYNAETSPKLALHLGDLVDAQKNIPCGDSILNLAQDTLFITPGNHDIYFYQWEEFRSFFKSSVYWFDTNNDSKKLDLFICLDSAEGTLGTKQTKWLKDLLGAKSQEGYRHIIVFTHSHLWKFDMSQGTTSNYALEETYELTDLLARYNVEYVWSGHQHARQRVSYKGVQYLVLNATKDAEKGQSYMIAHMGDEISYDYIDYPNAK